MLNGMGNRLQIKVNHCGGFMDNSVHKKKLPNMHAPMKNTEGFRVSTP